MGKWSGAYPVKPESSYTALGTHTERRRPRNSYFCPFPSAVACRRRQVTEPGTRKGTGRRSTWTPILEFGGADIFGGWSEWKRKRRRTFVWVDAVTLYIGMAFCLLGEALCERNAITMREFRMQTRAVMTARDSIGNNRF